MKLHFSITLASIALEVLLATSGGAIAQDVGRKAAKSTSHATIKVAKETAAGSTTGAEKTSSASEYSVKKTGHGR